MCHKKFLHLLVLHFPPLVVTTNSGGGETDLLQIVINFAVCSVPGRDTFSTGAGMVSAVGVALQTPVCAASKNVLC